MYLYLHPHERVLQPGFAAALRLRKRLAELLRCVDDGRSNDGLPEDCEGPRYGLEVEEDMVDEAAVCWRAVDVEWS